jgi:hypothetical protein
MKKALAVAIFALSVPVFAQNPPDAPPQGAPAPKDAVGAATGPDLGEAAASRVMARLPRASLRSLSTSPSLRRRTAASSRTTRLLR